MTGKKRLIFTLLLLGSFSLFAQNVHQHEGDSHDAEQENLHGEEEAHGEEINVSQVMLEHILDSHDWHITDIPSGTDEQGHTEYAPIALHLPWMIYDTEAGFVFASNTHALLEKGYLPYEMSVLKLNPGVDSHGLVDEHGHAHLHDIEVFKAENVNEEATVIDMSITKTALQMILIGLLLLVVFTSVARAYTRREGQAPKGLQSLMELIIVFLREEVAKPYLGANANRFFPYLLTLFFFIWFSNLFGLLPFNSNIAGNISVTAALAVLTFIITQFNGSKDHWKHVFNTPGVPWWLKFGIPLMPLVEFIGLFTKPFALAVRLFANITAGHFMVLGLVSLIFIMGDNGTSMAGGLGIMPLSVLFTMVIFALEMIVAIIQPFIFTLLTAVFIGMAMETHDDHHH
ncbi:MAG: F0F1 ATP synthase subunit A [Bacteroidia bacterium]|nr:F0F1 ATP synthase subunit A [Bacteroidia bacterium]